jgi:hypothetical protein
VAHYSFVAVAPQPLVITRPAVLLDEGQNVFTAVVENIDDFMQLLADKGVTVQKAFCLDPDPMPAGQFDTIAERLLNG